jgi:multimeric flavodoxin WrbA
VIEAARSAAGPRSEVVGLDCFEAGAEDLAGAAGILLGTPARFGYMSGAMKDFLERIYYSCLEAGLRLPYGLFVKGDTDTSGAVQSVERIVSGLAWRRVLPVLEVVGETTEEQRRAAEELGAAFVAGIESGVF